MAERAPTQEIEQRTDNAPQETNEGEPRRSTIYMLWSEVMQESTLSKTVIQRLMKRREFPIPVQLSPNRVAWLRSEIEDWVDARERDRETKQQAA
jgi:predicted DNA-binding transcriptional regulator AlpA